jgi:hypothetical protein
MLAIDQGIIAQQRGNEGLFTLNAFLSKSAARHRIVRLCPRTLNQMSKRIALR